MSKKINTFTIRKDRYGYLARCDCKGCLVSSPVKMSDNDWRRIFTSHVCYPAYGFDIKIKAKRAWEME